MPSLGTQLRNAREAKGVSLHDLAEITRIKTQQIQGLERDDFSTIPAPMYGKGFIRLIAPELGLDPAPLIRQYEAQLSTQPPAPGVRTAPPVKEQKPGKKGSLIGSVKSLFGGPEMDEEADEDPEESEDEIVEQQELPLAAQNTAFVDPDLQASGAETTEPPATVKTRAVSRPTTASPAQEPTVPAAAGAASEAGYVPRSSTVSLKSLKHPIGKPGSPRKRAPIEQLVYFVQDYWKWLAGAAVLLFVLFALRNCTSSDSTSTEEWGELPALENPLIFDASSTP